MMVILSMLMINGCNKSASQSPILDRLKSMNSYSAVVDMEVYGVKEVAHYSMKQYYNNGKVRVDITKPENMLGNVRIVSDGKEKIYSEKAKDDMQYMDNGSQNGLISIGIFIDIINNWDNTVVESLNRDGKKYISVKLKLNDNSRYNKEAVVLFDESTLKPERMEIYDESGKVRIGINYSEFKYNPQIDDTLFNIG